MKLSKIHNFLGKFRSIYGDFNVIINDSSTIINTENDKVDIVTIDEVEKTIKFTLSVDPSLSPTDSDITNSPTDPDNGE